MTRAARAALRRQLKRTLVAAGLAGIASRRVIRAIIILLGIEHI